MTIRVPISKIIQGIKEPGSWRGTDRLDGLHYDGVV